MDLSVFKDYVPQQKNRNPECPCVCLQTRVTDPSTVLIYQNTKKCGFLWAKALLSTTETKRKTVLWLDKKIRELVKPQTPPVKHGMFEICKSLLSVLNVFHTSFYIFQNYICIFSQHSGTLFLVAMLSCWEILCIFWLRQELCCLERGFLWTFAMLQALKIQAPCPKWILFLTSGEREYAYRSVTNIGLPCYIELFWLQLHDGQQKGEQQLSVPVRRGRCGEVLRGCFSAQRNLTSKK